MIHRYWERDKNKKLSEEAALQTLICSIVTEKSFLLGQNLNQYVFKVASWANKIQIQQAFERILGVKVVSVNTLVVKGKARRFKGHFGRRSDYKKAIVRLEEGQSLKQDWNLGEVK